MRDYALQAIWSITPEAVILLAIIGVFAILVGLELTLAYIFAPSPSSRDKLASLGELAAEAKAARAITKNAEYVASPETLYRYPGAGDPSPPGGAKVLLLTEGSVAVIGRWSKTGGFVAWAPLPKRDKIKERGIRGRRS